MSDATTTELLALNRRLLECIFAGDWATYEELCDPSLTCFEPETRGQWIEGLDFHHFYFKLGGAAGPLNITISTPHVRVMGDVAVISLHSHRPETRWQRQPRNDPVGRNPYLATAGRTLAARAFPPDGGVTAPFRGSATFVVRPRRISSLGHRPLRMRQCCAHSAARLRSASKNGQVQYP